MNITNIWGMFFSFYIPTIILTVSAFGAGVVEGKRMRRKKSKIMKVFSKEKFIEVMGEKHYKLISMYDEYNWVDRANGKEVKNGYVNVLR